MEKYNIIQTSNEEVNTGRDKLGSLLETIASGYRKEKAEILSKADNNPKWKTDYDKLDHSLISDITKILSSGILNKLDILTEQQKSSIPANGKEANYRKDIIIRGDDWIFTTFVFGSKASVSPETGKYGATTALHGHSLRCEATSFVPKGLAPLNVATPIEVTFDSNNNPEFARELKIANPSIRLPETGIEGVDIEHDYHAVFNGDPDRTAYTGHFYLTKGIGADKNGNAVYIDISKDEFPATAINMKNAPGILPDFKTGKIDRNNWLPALYIEQHSITPAKKSELEVAV